jgi:acetylornithine deacetylase/succinyl-diaminopimelate desuccinylase-like protein
VCDAQKVDPWAAIEDEEGNIFGRGTQDMKVYISAHTFRCTIDNNANTETVLAAAHARI